MGRGNESPLSYADSKSADRGNSDSERKLARGHAPSLQALAGARRLPYLPNPDL